MKQFLLTILSITLISSLQAQEKKVLFIGVDGVRSDALQQANTPTWDSLTSVGLYTYTSWHVDITVSGPSWSNMLTGVWSDKHGVTNNSYTGSHFNDYPYFVTRAKEHIPTLKAVEISSWTPMCDVSIGGAVYNNGWDASINPPTDDAVEAVALTQLLDPDLDVLFIHIDDVDAQGHGNGFSPTVAPYMAQIEYIDGQIRRILNGLKNRSNYANEDWLVLMTTDHGGIGTGHGGPTRAEREIWWVAAGPSVPHAQITVDLPTSVLGEYTIDLNPDPADYRDAPLLVDIGVTALDHLLGPEGVDPETVTEWDLDGQSWLGYSTYVEETENADFDFGIYPNPNEGLFTLLVGNEVDLGDFNWSIIDVSGKVIRTGAEKRSVGMQNLLPMDITGLNSGIYSLRISDNSKVSTRRIIKK
ncbi:MAG: alkaline phosphatase family protein [Flavobacteriales bacterium]|nr:alkaline phosphatase family protein [Flavobacteriales bacterium]